MTFENDVFVSYAHIDDQTPVPGQTGWITALHEWLQVRLAQLLGKEPKIWRDPKLQGNDIFADSIADRLPRVAVFVSVLSPRYVKSEWCKRELSEFLQASVVTGGIRVADSMRVFKVIKTPVPSDLIPPSLQSTFGYEFYYTVQSKSRTHELGPMSPPDVMQLYWSKLDDLAHDIARLITALEHEAERTLSPTADTVVTGPVYLAETSHDLNDRRDAIRRELQSHGYAVLPERPLPLYGPDCVSFVRGELERCRLSIHMVGNNYGVVPEGSTESIVVLQHDQAIAHGAAGNFCRLVWMPPDLAPTDARQQEFVARLHADSAVQSGADVLKTPLEDFKTVLHVRLNTPADVDPRRLEDVGPKHVYVVCDQLDREAVRPLEQFLYSEGFEVVSSVFEGDEASIRRDHEENLIASHAVLIYYGAGGELWFRTKLRELKKCAGYRRGEPFLAKGVVLAPPLNAEKFAYRSHDLSVITWSEGSGADLFEPFFSRLR